ncbi:MAG: hypothetical protein ACOYOK_09545 [Pseudobdellovibrionaceae bacterium]
MFNWGLDKILVVFIIICDFGSMANANNKDSFFDAGNEVRCFRTYRTKEEGPKNQCDLSQFESLGNDLNLIRFSNRSDSWQLLTIIQRMNPIPERVANDASSILSYKYINKGKSVLFHCIIRYPSGNRDDTNCFFYYSNFRPDPFVQISENAYFVNIRFYESALMRKIKSGLDDNRTIGFLSEEKKAIEVQDSPTGLKNYPLASFFCYSNYCEFRAAKDVSDIQAPKF